MFNLNQNTLTKWRMKTIEKHFNELDKCKPIVSQQLIKKSKFDEEYFNYFLEVYVSIWTLLKYDKIVKMPLFIMIPIN